MDPLTNSILGMLFLGVGAAATVVMYYLRGHSTGASKRPARSAPGVRDRAVVGRRPKETAAKPARTGRTAPPPTTTKTTAPPRREARPDQALIDAAVKTETKWYKVAEPDEMAEGSVKAVDVAARTIAFASVAGPAAWQAMPVRRSAAIMVSWRIRSPGLPRQYSGPGWRHCRSTLRRAIDFASRVETRSYTGLWREGFCRSASRSATARSRVETRSYSAIASRELLLQ